MFCLCFVWNRWSSLGLLGGAIDSAKLALATARGWISGMVQEIEVEMRKKGSSSKPVTTSNIDYTSSQMVISDQARKGEVKTIGDEIGRTTPVELKLELCPEQLNTSDEKSSGEDTKGKSNWVYRIQNSFYQRRQL